MMRGAFRLIFFSGAIVLVLPLAERASAQQQVPEVQNMSDGLETINVTASRRSETTQDVGGGVTALSSDDLSQMDAHTLTDFASAVPSLSFQENSPTNNLLAIRGVASSTTELGSAVGLYLDDVPLGASTQFGLGSQSFNLNLFDMRRVEILDGPQGTLYGANALGGAIKYITREPELGVYDAEAESEGSGTMHGSGNDSLMLMANVPAFGNAAAIRVDGVQEYDSGYINNSLIDRSNIGAARTLAGRISILADITPDLEVRLTAFTQNIAANGLDESLRSLSSHQPVIGTYNQAFAVPQPNDSSLTLYSANINWSLDWAKLTSIIGIQYNHGTSNTDVSYFYDTLFDVEAAIQAIPAAFGSGPLNSIPYDLFVDTNTKKLTQEIRLASLDNESFEWVLGGYFADETTVEAVNLIDKNTPNGDLPPPYSSFAFSGVLPSTYSEYAVYGDATYYFTDQLDLTLGLRYSIQHQFYRSDIFWLPYGAPYGQPQSYGAPSDQSAATYLINPRYRASDDTLLYAKISSGYRPGGPNFFPPPLPAKFQPDSLWNYEVGEKSTFLDDRMIANVDLYDIEWQGIQTTENVNGVNQLVNAGNARIMGAEASLNYRILPQLTLNGTAAHTDAQLTTPAPVLGVYTDDDRLPMSPHYNFAISATYEFGLGGGYAGALNISDTWVGERNSGYANSATNVLYQLPAYNTVGLNGSLYLSPSAEIVLYVKNVFDTVGQISANTLNNAFDTPSSEAPVPVTLSQPRTIGLTLKVSLDK